MGTSLSLRWNSRIVFYEYVETQLMSRKNVKRLPLLDYKDFRYLAIICDFPPGDFVPDL
jgi:hypothetical protein